MNHSEKHGASIEALEESPITVENLGLFDLENSLHMSQYADAVLEDPESALPIVADRLLQLPLTKAIGIVYSLYMTTEIVRSRFHGPLHSVEEWEKFLKNLAQELLLSEDQYLQCLLFADQLEHGHNYDDMAAQMRQVGDRDIGRVLEDEDGNLTLQVVDFLSAHDTLERLEAKYPKFRAAMEKYREEVFQKTKNKTKARNTVDQVVYAQDVLLDDVTSIMMHLPWREVQKEDLVLSSEEVSDQDFEDFVGAQQHVWQGMVARVFKWKEFSKQPLTIQFQFFRFLRHSGKADIEAVKDIMINQKDHEGIFTMFQSVEQHGLGLVDTIRTLYDQLDHVSFARLVHVYDIGLMQVRTTLEQFEKMFPGMTDQSKQEFAKRSLRRLGDRLIALQASGAGSIDQGWIDRQYSQIDREVNIDTFRSLQVEDPEISPEILVSAEFSVKTLGDLAPDQVQDYIKKYENVWVGQGYPQFGSYLAGKVQEKYGNPDQAGVIEIHQLAINNEVVANMTIETQPDGSKYLGGFYINPDYKQGRFGVAMARQRIKPLLQAGVNVSAHVFPNSISHRLLHSMGMDDLDDAELYFKPENVVLQKVGSIND